MTEEFCFLLMQITTGTSIFPYLIYVLTVSGVAYLLKIRNVSAYASRSSTVFPVNDVLELNVRDYIPNNVTVTAMAATTGSVVIGRSDGSICCFQLGGLDPSAPGMVNLAWCHCCHVSFGICLL